MLRFLWIPMMALTLALGANADDTTELQRLRQENAQLREQIAQLQNDIASTRQQTQQQDKQIAELQAKRDHLTVLAGITEEGDLVASSENRIITQYSDEKNLTSVRSAPEPMALTHGSRADHYLSIAFSYPGQKITEPPQAVRLYIQTVFSGHLYSASKEGTFFVNGTPETVAIADYRAKQRSQSRAGGKNRADLSNEVVAFELDLETLERWSRAATIQGRLAQVSFEFTPQQVATLKAMHKRIEMGR